VTHSGTISMCLFNTVGYSEYGLVVLSSHTKASVLAFRVLPTRVTGYIYSVVPGLPALASQSLALVSRSAGIGHDSIHTITQQSVAVASAVLAHIQRLPASSHLTTHAWPP
jgi:hypothetical protein